LIGLAWYVYRQMRTTSTTLIPISFLLLQFIVIFIGVVRWSLQTPASQGRLLFPAVAAISALLAIGWMQIVCQLRQHFSRAPLADGLPVVFLGLAAVILPFTE